MKFQLRLDLRIKFRAFGHDLLNIQDHEHFDLPDEVKIVGTIIGVRTIGHYSAHGVDATLSLVEANSGNTNSPLVTTTS